LKIGHALASFVFLLTGSVAAHGQSEIDRFYRGKTVTIVVGMPAGSTFDDYARLVATHLSRHIPGIPSIIVQSMPGANSLLGASHVYNVAPQDGTVIGASVTNLPVLPMIDSTGVRFDAVKFQWLPTPAEFPTALIVWRDSPVKSLDDLREKSANFGSIAAGAPPTVAIGLYNEVLKTKMRAVLGYAGLQAAVLAMESGELDGYPSIPMDTLVVSYKGHLDAGRIKVLVQNGESRSDEFPDVPTLLELLNNDSDRALVRLASAFTVFTTPYMMGPGVPADRVAAMRKAFMETFSDPAFVADAAKRSLRLTPVSDEIVTQRVAAAFKNDKGVVGRLRAIYEQAKEGRQ
jgi:tripartite-type tricarboxylate transporter receptor subunit TctC